MATKGILSIPVTDKTYGAAQRYFRDVVMAYDGDECMIWPFTCHSWGYGQIYAQGRMQCIHPILCEQEHGPRPSPNHDAAHSCGNGHLACVTKRHLDWKTKKQNQADRLRHGTDGRGDRHHSAKLTTDEVREIIGLKGTMTQKEISLRFGVRTQQVSRIHRRERWGWLA